MWVDLKAYDVGVVRCEEALVVGVPEVAAV